MIVPGSNLLNMALGIIGRQQVEWLKYAGVIETSSGLQVPTWAPAIMISGSLQPVDVRLLQQLGLDWTRNYVTFFATAEFREPNRDQSSDRIRYAGRLYQVVSKTAWWQQDGWERVICVEVPDA